LAADEQTQSAATTPKFRSGQANQSFLIGRDKEKQSAAITPKFQSDQGQPVFPGWPLASRKSEGGMVVVVNSWVDQ
jgi:hypothetical protein